VALVFFLHGQVIGTWAARIPAIADGLHLGAGEIGLALMAETLAGVCALPVAGWLVWRWGSSGVVAAGIPLLASTLALVPVAPNLVVLALVLAGLGISAGQLDMAMNAHGVAVEQHHDRLVLSSLHGAWSLGGSAASAIAVVAVATGTSPRAHFALVAAGMALVGLGVWSCAAPAVDGGAADEAPARLARPPRILVPLALLAFCGLLGESTAWSWSAVYVSGPVHGGEQLGAWAVGVFSMAMFTFRMVGDLITRRVGPVAVVRAGGTVATVGLALAIAAPNPATALVAFALMGMGLAIVVPIAYRAAGSLPGIPPAVGISALTTVGYSAFLFAPPMIGAIAEAASMRVAFVPVLVALVTMVALARQVQVGHSSEHANR
jgi:MFS family permease